MEGKNLKNPVVQLRAYRDERRNIKEALSPDNHNFW